MKKIHVAQALLSVSFASLGAVKLSQPLLIPWAADVGETVTRCIGVCEIVGGLGVVFPKPVVASLAAGGLATIMVLAALFHLSRGELHGPPINLALGALAGFVVWERSRTYV